MPLHSKGRNPQMSLDLKLPNLHTLTFRRQTTTVVNINLTEQWGIKIDEDLGYCKMTCPNPLF
jgi:hypothetical protein